MVKRQYWDWWMHVSKHAANVCKDECYECGNGEQLKVFLLYLTYETFAVILKDSLQTVILHQLHSLDILSFSKNSTNCTWKICGLISLMDVKLWACATLVCQSVLVVFAREAKLLKTGMNQDYSLMSPELYLHLYECASWQMFVHELDKS